MWIRDGKNSDTGSGMEKSWIRAPEKTSWIRKTGFGNPLSSCYTRTITYAGGTDSLKIYALLKSLKIWALENYVCLLRHTYTDS